MALVGERTRSNWKLGLLDESWDSRCNCGVSAYCGTLVKKGVEVMQYWTCPECGANLDPGEKCDCEKNKKCPVRVEPRDGTNNK